jgi:acetyl-CoA acyltransferase 2
MVKSHSHLLSKKPFGTFGGKLSHLSATELGGLASVGAIKSLNKPIKIDSTIYGNVLQTSSGISKIMRPMLEKKIRRENSWT